MTTPTKWITILTAVLGIWLFSFPVWTGSPILDRWNDFVAGGIITTFSCYNFARDHRGIGPSKPVSTGLVLVGVWLLFAPFVIDVRGPLLWNDIVVGVLVTAFAIYNLYFASLTDTSPIRNYTNDT